jgi:hypothetical protein
MDTTNAATTLRMRHCVVLKMFVGDSLTNQNYVNNNVLQF